MNPQGPTLDGSLAGVRSRRARLLLPLLVLVACRPIEEGEGVAPAVRRAAPAAAPTPTRYEAPAAATATYPDFVSVAERLRPSVVSVVSTHERAEADTNGRVLRGIGSGMLVSTSGHVLTNQHVIAGAAKVDIELTNRSRVRARVLASDDLLDLALLELESPVAGLEPVVFRDRPAAPGEWVMTMGQPYGLGHTVTVGVVSGLGRDHTDLGRPPGLRPDGFWSFIQTDASVNIGNSGGPLVDLTGQVLGLNTAVRSDGEGLAFAIPAAIARRFLEEVWTYGRVRHARLGLTVNDVGPDVFPGRLSAVRVTAVEAGGPGARAGLKPNDIILAIDDQSIARGSELAYHAQLRGVGAQIDLLVQRGAEPRRHRVIPSEAAP